MDILHLETMSITVAVIFFSIFPYVRFHGQIRSAVLQSFKPAFGILFDETEFDTAARRRFKVAPSCRSVALMGAERRSCTAACERMGAPGCCFFDAAAALPCTFRCRGSSSQAPFSRGPFQESSRKSSEKWPGTLPEHPKSIEKTYLGALGSAGTPPADIPAAQDLRPG